LLEQLNFRGKFSSSPLTLDVKVKIRIYSDEGTPNQEQYMVTFFLCWAAMSVVGTFIALSLVWSGKRNSRNAGASSQQSNNETQPEPVKLLA
jgi:hypothetical protein